MIYGVLSDFNNFTPIIADKVEQWDAAENRCSFKVKGFSVELHIVEKEPHKLVKITGADGSPIDFTLWMQLVSLADNDTRMRIVLHTKLNVMMKMMIGKKIQEGIDQIAERVAESFNSAPI